MESAPTVLLLILLIYSQFILYLHINLLQFLFVQSVPLLGTIFPLWQVLLISSCMYRRTELITALTTQAVTAVPVPVDMEWILMESLALVRNMTKQNIVILESESIIFFISNFHKL